MGTTSGLQVVSPLDGLPTAAGQPVRQKLMCCDGGVTALLHQTSICFDRFMERNLFGWLLLLIVEFMLRLAYFVFPFLSNSCSTLRCPGVTIC